MPFKSNVGSKVASGAVETGVVPVASAVQVSSSKFRVAGRREAVLKQPVLNDDTADSAGHDGWRGNRRRIEWREDGYERWVGRVVGGHGHVVACAQRAIGRG